MMNAGTKNWNEAITVVTIAKRMVGGATATSRAGTGGVEAPSIRAASSSVRDVLEAGHVDDRGHRAAPDADDHQGRERPVGRSQPGEALDPDEARKALMGPKSLLNR